MSGDVSTPAQDQTPESSDASVTPETAAAAPEPAVETTGADLDPADRMQQVDQQFQTLKSEHETLQAQYMRITADFDNFASVRAAITMTSVSNWLFNLSEILPVVDNFERARRQLNPESEARLCIAAIRGFTSNSWMFLSSKVLLGWTWLVKFLIPTCMRLFCVRRAVSTPKT